jgi:DNA-binding transcriptional LysR family regulator
MSNNRSHTNWDDFRFFLAVARTGTLSAAAGLLGTEHTTVARRVSTLEGALNTRLFHKSNLGYSLTEAGDKLLAAAETMESASVEAQLAAQNEDHAIIGAVRVGAPDGFGSIFLAPRMHLITERYPKLQVELLATARLFSLSKREADIAISLSTAQHARVVSRRLIDYRLCVYASRSYLESAAPILEPEDIKAHSFVGYIEELLFTPELNYLNVIGADVEARIRSTNLLAQVHATLAGSGLCILPAFIASAYPTLIPVLPKQLSIMRSFHMHIHEDHRKAAHVREVAAFIVAEVNRNQSLFKGD